MTDYTPEVETEPGDTYPTEPINAPTPQGPRSLIVQLQFEQFAGDPNSEKYISRLEYPDTLTADQYAKVVAETVERTVLLHLGALPVLAKQEVAA